MGTPQPSSKKKGMGTKRACQEAKRASLSLACEETEVTTTTLLPATKGQRSHKQKEVRVPTLDHLPAFITVCSLPNRAVTLCTLTA